MKRMAIQTITLDRARVFDEFPEFDLPDDAQVVDVVMSAFYCTISYITTTIRPQAEATK